LRILIRNYEGKVFEYPELIEDPAVVPPTPAGTRGEAAVLAIRSQFVPAVPVPLSAEAVHGRHC